MPPQPHDHSQPCDRFPLAPLQQGMLFHTLAAPESTMYVEQYQLRLEGALDLASFRAAWEAVCQQHPALRTEFDWQLNAGEASGEGESLPSRGADQAGRPGPLQVVRSAVDLPLVVEDWRDRSTAEQAAQLPRVESAEREREFDLSRAPLFRLRLIRLGERTWQLLWTHHHILLDGWSVGLILHDVATGYAAVRRGAPVTFPPAPAYRDFVARTDSPDLARAEQYWTAALAGVTEPTSLGIARALGADGSPAHRSGSRAAARQRLARTLPRELGERLEQLTRTHQVTLDTVLTGAWAMVLGRYSGADDVVFGVTSSGRQGCAEQLPGLARTAGLLINTLPARVKLEWDQPVARWLATLQQEQTRSREFELAPLDRVQAWSDVPTGRRLFDSILVVEDFPFDALNRQRLGDLRIAEAVSVQETNYPLTLLAFPRERLVIEALFDDRVLDPRLVRAVLGHLETVLEGLAGASVLSEVELMPHAERAELLSRGAVRESPPAGDGVVPARFAAWAQREPDRIAVSSGDERCSYRELLARVSPLAHRLRGLGVGPGVLVGICLPRGVDLVVAVLAVACAGGGYVPVDRRHPAARARTVLSDASVAVLLTDRDVAAELGPDSTVPVTVCLDDPDEQKLLASLPGTLPTLEVDAHDVAYVIYTSGSTGAPKGVVVEHAQVARLFDATEDWFGFGPDDVWTLFHSIAFDFSVWELWGALANGGRLVVVPDGLTRDPAAFRELLIAEGVTVLNQTPSSFRALQHATLDTGTTATSRSPFRLRWVVFGGEQLDVPSLRPWLDRYGDQQPRLVNMYGITETTVHVTYRPITRADLRTGVPSPIGEPIGDLAVRLLDPRGRLVPVGVPGEIHVGGAGVARGYLHRPELTADRFVERVESPDEPRRWYRTGDRARWLPDGGLEFLGRLDDQVKIRGHRIELGEVEGVINGHPQVRDVVVAARQTDADGHRQLVAYVIPDGSDLTWATLRRWLTERVPDYLVPAGLVSLDRLPLTPNGKVDRAALPDPLAARPDEGGLVSPGNEVERILVEVVAEVLGLERVGITDNFFALGGDSILTIQVATRAGRRGVSVTPAQLFAHQTVVGLAQVAGRDEAGRVGGVAGAEQGEVTGDVPATPVQAWFHHLGLPHAGDWNLPLLLLMRWPVRTEWLTGALTALVAHHDLLRLRVTHDQGQPRQRIVPMAEHGPVPVTNVDLTATDSGQFAARVETLARETQAGLDLERGPLLRAVVFRAPHGEPDRLLLVAHHLVVDNVSWQILVEDLATGCHQLAEGSLVRLPAKTTDFPRWARHLTELARSDQVADDAHWWLDTASGRVPELPVDGGDPEAANLEGGSDVVDATLDEPATRALLAPANQAYRTRTDELLLTALAQAVAGWTGTPQLLVDVEGHGRDIATGGGEVSRTVGWFTTITPAWLDLAGTDWRSPAPVIKAVKEQLRAMPRRGAGYGLARWLREDDLARLLSELPRAQVSFNYLGRLDRGTPQDAPFTLAPEQVSSPRHPDNPRPYLIDVIAGVRDEKLQLYLVYSVKHHSRSTVERLAAACLDALRALVDHCVSPDVGGATPSDFPLAQVDQRQLDRLVAERGGFEDLYPLAPLQRGLLFHTLANPESGVYFEQFSIRLDGAVDVDVFERAWSALIERHALLRAGVVWQGLTVPHLVVQERVELPLTHHDWSDLDADAQTARLRELLADDRVQGFELTEAPLTRLHLIRLAAQRWHLIWSHHHILLDGWSVALLIQEVFDSYEAIRTGQHVPAPPPPPYRDYIGYLESLDFSGAWAHWRRVLAGVTGPTPLGADRPAVRTGRQDADYGRVQRRLPADRSDAVREFARAHGLTLDTVLHGAWALLLAQRSGHDDVVFGVASSGRPPALAGVEEMVGLFINTLPARVRVSRDQPIASWLAGLLRDQVRTREFEHTPLDQIRDWTSVPPDLPLFDSGRGLENYPMDGSRYRTGSITISEIQTFEQSNYALSFIVVPDEALSLQLWYDALRFDPDTAAHLLRMAETLVDELAADPDTTVGEVLARVAAPDDQVGPPTGSDASLPRLVEHWATRSPARTAVCRGDARVTYQRLDQYANQVADWLRDQGVGTGARVGVALPGSVDSVVAMLGILRAGALYVPLPADWRPVWERFGTSVRPSLVLTGPDERDSSAAPAVRFDLSSLAGRPATPVAVPVAPTDAATVVWWYAPDGAIRATELSHGELVRRARDRREEVTGRDVVAQLADPGTEIAAWENWAALGNGGCLALCAADSGPAAWWQPVRDQRVTVLTCTADSLAELLDQDPSAFDGVRLLLLRGDLPAPYVRRLRVTQQSLALEPVADLEAGRVAHELRGLPMAREVVVTPAPDRRRLVVHLAPDTTVLDREPGGGLAERHVGDWRALYDRTYADGEPADPEFNIAGWNSSYTGGPIAPDAMAEWRTTTIERIRALHPDRVLEIGCGTGLLLFGLLDDCEHCVGTDFSPVCLTHIHDHLATRDGATREKVTLLERTADDVTGLAPGSFDVVILNSVVQYFPGPAYLARVLDAVLRLAAPDGVIFLGDLRHHGLREAFGVSVELHRGVDMLPADELRARVSRALEQERELLVDPRYLTALAAERPEVGAVQVMPRRGRHDNELTRYRYDAVLRLGPPQPDPDGVTGDDVIWYDWHRDVLSRSEIGWLLDHEGDAVGVTGVPNARIAADVEAARLLSGADGPGTAGELRLAAQKASPGMDPEELYELADSRGWSVAVSWATHHTDGSVNVLFQRGPGATGPGALHTAGPDADQPPAADGPLINNPLRTSLMGELERQVWQALPGILPEGVSVSGVVVVEELPRTADGGVDEAALPAVVAADDGAGAADAGAVPPRTADELRLARIWEQTLRVKPVDVRTSFFDLGGNSLLAIRVVDEATRMLGRDVGLAVLLREPTIEGMAAALRAAPAPWTPLVEITPGEGTPFFCVHPAGGSVLCYAPLARQLGPGQPFSALQARGLEGDDPPYEDLTAMAARYVADVRGRQPTGPYLLGGYSMGGLVAYEMAQQLVSAGESVNMLVLIDTPAPELIEDLPDEAGVLARSLETVLPLDVGQLRAMPAAERLRYVLAEAERAQVVPPGMEPDRAQHLFQVYATHLDAARRYRPRPYGGQVCQLRAADTGITVADYGWDGLLTGAGETVEIPGDHETIIWPPNVHRLAEVLEARLATAVRRPGRT